MMTESIIKNGIQKELELSKIKRNPYNNYDMEDIEELKNSIITNGLITPISVIGPDEEGNYMLIAGERRLNIFKELLESGEERYQKMPVYVVGPIDMGETEQKLLIESSNLDVRDSFDKNAHYLNVIRLLKQYKEENNLCCGEYVKLRGQFLKCSPRYARFYETIFKYGDESLIELVESGDIGVSKAGRIATISKDLQASAVEEIKAGQNPTEVVEKYRNIDNEEKKEPKKQKSFDFQDLDDDFDDFNESSYDDVEDTFENDFEDIDFSSMSTDFLNTGFSSDSGKSSKYESEMNTVLNWCKKILNTKEPTEDEWEVIEACKKVANYF